MKHYTMMMLLAVIIAATLGSCNIKKPQHYPYEEVTPVKQVGDSTIYGICGSGSTNDQLQIITDNEDTLYFDVTEARKNGMVLPGYSRGENLCVIADTTGTIALKVINKDMLLGEWVIPSPYDGSTPSGIIIKDNGDAEGFEQQGDIEYKAWRIFNGQLQIVETRGDDTDLYYTLTYEITRMTADSLYLSNVNEDETFEYGRYVPEPEVDLGINFEDDDPDNYVINW
ncbi:MAG: hypothetical protein J5797_00640 [Prevotella sp.]|nr:hypothetical protein [Prevotella sp.]